MSYRKFILDNLQDKRARLVRAIKVSPLDHINAVVGDFLSFANSSIVDSIERNPNDNSIIILDSIIGFQATGNVFDANTIVKLIDVIIQSIEKEDISIIDNDMDRLCNSMSGYSVQERDGEYALLVQAITETNSCKYEDRHDVIEKHIGRAYRYRDLFKIVSGSVNSDDIDESISRCIKSYEEEGPGTDTVFDNTLRFLNDMVDFVDAESAIVHSDSDPDAHSDMDVD